MVINQFSAVYTYNRRVSHPLIASLSGLLCHHLPDPYLTISERVSDTCKQLLSTELAAISCFITVQIVEHMMSEWLLVTHDAIVQASHFQIYTQCIPWWLANQIPGIAVAIATDINFYCYMCATTTVKSYMDWSYQYGVHANIKQCFFLKTISLTSNVLVLLPICTF